MGTIYAYGEAVGDVPSNIVLSNYKVEKDFAVGSTIGSLSAEDADVGSVLTFYMAEGSGDDDNGYFALNADKLILTAALDWEN